MTERIVKPLPFWRAVEEVIVFYVHVFKHIIGLVILAALLQGIITILTPENPTIGWVVSLLGSVVSIFFYAWILYRADSVFMNRPETYKDALRVAKKRFLPLVGLLVVYLVIVFVFVLFGFGMQMLGNLVHLELLFGLITLAIAIYIFTLIAFSMPAVVLDSMSVFQGFQHSARLVRGNWWHTFGVMAIFIIPLIILSLLVLFFPTRDNLWLSLYEFIFHILTYPLMISLILVLYYDLKARHQMEGFKQVTQ